MRSSPCLLERSFASLLLALQLKDLYTFPTFVHASGQSPFVHYIIHVHTM